MIPHRTARFGVNQVRRQLRQGAEHEDIFEHIWPGNPEWRLVDNAVAVHQQVDVERPRGELCATALPACLIVNFLDVPLDFERLFLRLERCNEIEEVGTVETNRGVAVGARKTDGAESLPEFTYTEPKVVLGIDVAAETEVNGRHGP